jgi:hypothetical protein
MTTERLNELYSNLLDDVDFDRLDLGLKKPNIFSILKISRNEIRHSNFLSWLLNPKDSHGLGDIFLKRFLREVFSSDKFEGISQVDVEGLDLTRVDVLREWNNIDILISTPELVVCVENKVFSRDHSNQLLRYRKIIEEHFPNKTKTFVYLNPEGEESSEEVENYYPLSYEFIVETLERIIEVYIDSMKMQVVQYIKDYVTTLKQDIMGTDKLVDISRKIYSNHKELLDFIIENKPDETLEIRDLLFEVVRENGFEIGSESKFYVRFLSPEAQPLVYINKKVKNGWKKRESFLHEIRLRVKSGVLVYVPVISPSDPEYDSDGLLNLLLEIDGFKTPSGKKWRVPFQKNVKFNYDEFESLTREEKKEKLQKFFEKILPSIKKIDKKLLDNSELLMEWKDC